jgi:hypothetical protein
MHWTTETFNGRTVTLAHGPSAQNGTDEDARDEPQRLPPGYLTSDNARNIIKQFSHFRSPFG